MERSSGSRTVSDGPRTLSADHQLLRLWRRSSSKPPCLVALQGSSVAPVLLPRIFPVQASQLTRQAPLPLSSAHMLAAV